MAGTTWYVLITAQETNKSERFFELNQIKCNEAAYVFIPKYKLVFIKLE